MRAKAQRWVEGAVLTVAAHGYSFEAQMLRFPEMAFFDPSAPGQVLFRLWVHKSAYATSRWLRTGRRPIPVDLQTQVPRFKKDLLTGRFSIYVDEIDSPATAQECQALEAAAVWEPEHVEDRLRDYREGRKNVWVESLAPNGLGDGGTRKAPIGNVPSA